MLIDPISNDGGDGRRQSRLAEYAKSARSSLAQRARPTILLVEDDSDALEVLGLILTEAGYAVVAVRSGEEAIRVRNGLDFDLVITDIQMEGGDGFELIAQVRTESPRTPVIVHSGRLYVGAVDVLSIAQRLGAVATIAKPTSNEKLLETVARVLADADAARLAAAS